MEQGRIFIAIALSFLIFLVWNIFFVDNRPPQPGQQAAQAPQGEIAPQKPIESAAKTLPLTKEVPATPSAPGGPARTLTVDTPLFLIELSEAKAAVKRFTLKQYRESVEKGSPLKTLFSETSPFGAGLFDFEGKTLVGFDSAVFSSDAPRDAISVTDTDKTVSFSWRSPEGIVVEKHYTFSPKNYLFTLAVVLKNESGGVFKESLTAPLFRRLEQNGGGGYGFEGPSAMINSSVEEIEVKKIKDKPLAPGKVNWWAIEDRYFMCAAIPPPVEGGQVKFFSRENGLIEALYVQPALALEPQREQRFEYRYYLGPKRTEILKEAGYELEEAVNFGMFDFIAKPCVWLMNQIYRVLPNYGIAIILLTVLSKILLWPLGNKSYKSMAEMKKLQPLMTEIREKYKNDKKKQQQEIMNLYRTYKINPLGGCLPMVAQIPVFFALYRMLYEAIELRHAPFFGWITDLSAPDRLFRFGFSVPFMQPPYGIPVLTLVMGATMLLQQKMSPPPGDPSQAKMMMLMPIVFTVIFINFSSGLVLYWLVNNLLSIGQQYYVTRKNA